jgi:hypothetical protein
MKFEDVINAADPTGIRGFVNGLIDDVYKVSEIIKAKNEGKPIDIQKARDVVARIDQFADAAKSMPGGRLFAWQFKQAQKGAHKDLEKLEEYAKEDPKNIVQESKVEIKTEEAKQ